MTSNCITFTPPSWKRSIF